MNCYLACVAVVSCFLAVASGQHFVSDYEQSHWRDACFCLGFNPDEHRQAAECMYAIIYSAENYLSDGHGDLITHLFNARTLLHDFLHEDGHGHGSHGSHDQDSYEQLELWPNLYETTCTRDSLEGYLVVDSMYGSGTVCDDGFGITEAIVFCQSMGFEHGEYTTRNGDHLGLPIVLDDVSCMEGDHVSMCTHIGWDNHNCAHSEDVYLMCYYPYDPEVMMMHMCEDHGEGSYEEVYFWPSLGDITCGGEESVEGLVVVEVEGARGTVCANFGHNEARAICLNHGFMDGEVITRDGTMLGFEQVASGISCPEFDDWADFHECRIDRRYDETCYGMDAGVRCFHPQHASAGLYVYDNIHHNNPCQPEVYWPNLGDIQCMDDGTGRIGGIEALVIAHSNMDYERRGTVCVEGVSEDVAMAICNNHGFAHGEVITRDGMQWEMEQVIGGYDCPEPEYHEPYMSYMYDPYGMDPDMPADIMPMPYFHLDFGRCDTYETHAACFGMDAGVRCSNPRHPREVEHVWDQLTDTNPCMQERFYPNLGDLDCSEAAYGTVSGILVGNSNVDYQRRGTYCADSFGPNEAMAVCKSFGYRHGEVVFLDATQWELEMVSGGYVCPEVDPERDYFDMYECADLPLDAVCEMGPVALRCAEPNYHNNAVYTYDILNERNTCQYGDNPGMEVDLYEPRCGTNTVEGLLVVRNPAVSDEWGTVCDDMFSNIDAEVVCRQLGLFGGEEFDHNGEHTGLDIKLDDVECNGDELSLGECLAQIFGTHNCGHYEDVGVRCYFEVAAPEALCPVM